MRFAPLLVLVLLTAAPSLAELDSFGTGTGRDGALVVSAAGRVINLAAPLVTDAPAGSTVLSAEALTTVVPQSLVLIHRGIGLPASTPSGGATSVAPGELGRWELARVESVTAEPYTLKLTAPLVNSYAAQGTQVVVVPEYTTVTVNTGTSLVARPWDGRSGGIIAFLATGTVTNQGRISADGAGLRGGVFVNHVDLSGCSGLDVPREQAGSYKGEGVVVDRYGTASGRGHLVNGGGGGNCHNSGGGGGGHGGVGGRGGYGAGSDVGKDLGGLGGAALKYELVDQMLLGGGGGAGEGNDDDGSGGGAGGGIVLVRAGALAGAGLYTANGQAALATPGDDGAGGGGAGGAVILRASGRADCGGAQALGGAGGTVSEPTFVLGPGGGGGGGYVLVQGAVVACAANVAGGAAGTVTSDPGSHGPNYGALAGGTGVAREYRVSYRPPTTPTVDAPSNGAVGVPSRPRFEGKTDPGVRVIITIDDATVLQVNAGADGGFIANYNETEPMSTGSHRVTVVAESLGAYSARSSEVTFNVAATLEDGGVLVPPILVVPADGDAVGPTPLFAGVAPNGVTVGLEVDNGPEITVPVDAFGRFRYQVPADSPLSPGPHFVNVHAHTESGETGPFSPNTRFEVLAADGGSEGGTDAGTDVPDAGADAGSGASDAGGARCR